ncbi:hypothetical protein HYFRA_00009888 [Hymenoscyphus fraxineus]|uniref:Ring-like domain-containing protein n=1 Tax=Hymenoscyphus fraxineus TaxID=746836 RepID=A0A9N9L2A3_9HELO|nr:hypothetical protein HYFRA_00009888 [Hymenoscyphus fraxineus]
MLEYFSYKKIKKHQEAKKAKSPAGTGSGEVEEIKKEAKHKAKESKVQTPPPILSEEDEAFLERIAALSEGPPPPLPTRPTFGEEAGDATNNAGQMVVHDGREDLQKSESKDKGKGKEKEKEAAEAKKENKFTGFIGRTFSKRGKPDLKPTSNVPKHEAHREEDDLTTILDDLDLSASNNRAFSLSRESQELVAKFTVILKDLINGVPTAYDDLIHLLDDSSNTLSKGYEKLPSSLQKMVTTLPDKLTKYIAPELLAAAAEVQGVTATGAGAAGLKSFFTPSTLKDLVTKPGAVMGAFKAIMNALKLRFPAFLGTNVLLSLGLFILMFFFWYCHKRGREVRLEKEAKLDSEGRIIEIVDPELPAPPNDSPSSRSHHSRSSRSRDSSEERDPEKLARRRARRAEHERQKEEKRRAEKNSSRPSSSRHGSSYLKADNDRRSRDSRESRESRDGRDKKR